MLEGFLGADRFRDGIRLYMRRHREANATADDLWGALGEASGQPILEMANGWIRQTGYPLVDVALATEAAAWRVELKQRRFFADPGAAATAGGRGGDEVAGAGRAALPGREGRQGAAGAAARRRRRA